MLIAIILAQASIAPGNTINVRAVLSRKSRVVPDIEMQWRQKPSLAVQSKLAPKPNGAWRYGHIECHGLSKSGRLTSCTEADVDADDKVANAATLALAKYYRADKSMLAYKADVHTIFIDVQYQYRGIRNFGNCAPTFCTITPAPPPAPK